MTAQVVVLAGGLATRMRPHTDACPKSLLEVAGRPFVAWQLEALARAGFDDAVLCVGHLGDRVRDSVGDGREFGLRVRYSYDGATPLGTGGALRRASPLLDPAFLVTYGDSYLPFDYLAPLRDLREDDDALATMAVYENRDRWERSNSQVDGAHVVRYDKHADDPRICWVDYGAIALRREVLARIPDDAPFGLDVVQAQLARERKLRAYVATERFYEIGSPEGLLSTDRYLARFALRGAAS